ncbi:MAG: cation:dicarboxylase symporter family transporter [Gemmatimonadaceae bacterium]
MTRTSWLGSLTGRVFAALLLGFVGGWIAAAYPAPWLTTVVNIIAPIGTLWVNGIRMTVIPLVVSLLITGVASSLDARAVRSLTLRSFATFFGLLGVAAIFGLTVVPSLFAWLHLDPAAIAAVQAMAPAAPASQNAPSFADWLVNIIPANPVKAAADGAMLPLVVFATLFGLALLRVPVEKRRP